MAASTNVETVVREVGASEVGPLGVFRALKSLAALAYGGKNPLVKIHPEHLHHLANLFRDGGPEASLDYLRQEVELAAKREPSHPKMLSRGSDEAKFTLYVILALLAGPAQPGKTPPIEGYAVAACQALERIRGQSAANDNEKRQLEAELAGQIRMAAGSDSDFDAFSPARCPAPGEAQAAPAPKPTWRDQAPKAKPKAQPAAPAPEPAPVGAEGLYEPPAADEAPAKSKRGK